MEKPNPKNWSEYWKGSTITTFQGLFEKNYESGIFCFWNRHIAGNHKNILDIACGNGALCWIANEILNKVSNEAKITGIDFADINPFKRLGKNRNNYQNINFIAKTPAEEIPIDSSSVDLIVSQYGIEYSDLNKSIPEISRVLIAGGKACFIMHISESTLIKSEGQMLLACCTVLNEDRLHDKYLELDQLYRKIPDDKDPEIQRKKIEIHHLTYEIRSKFRVFRYKPDLENYIYRMEKAFSENTPRRSNKREKAILLAKHELSTYTSRLADLISAAQSPDDIDYLVNLLIKNNLSIIEKEPMYINGDELCGLSLAAIKH